MPELAFPRLPPGASSRPRAPEVEIVVPVYNEAAGLERASAACTASSATGSRSPGGSSSPTTPAPTRRRRSPASSRCSCRGVRHLRLEQKGRGRALRAAWSASPAKVVRYMDVDLSTDLRGLLPLVAPLMSGHSDLAIGTRLARGSRVVRGPKREFISRSYNRLLRTSCARGSPTRSAASRPSAATRSTGCWTTSGRRLVLRHRAAGARPAARPAHPRGAGRLGRRPGLARRHRAHRDRPTCAASRGCSAASPVATLHGHRRRQHARLRAAVPAAASAARRRPARTPPRSR